MTITTNARPIDTTGRLMVSDDRSASARSSSSSRLRRASALTARVSDTDAPFSPASVTAAANSSSPPTPRRRPRRPSARHGGSRRSVAAAERGAEVAERRAGPDGRRVGQRGLHSGAPHDEGDDQIQVGGQRRAELAPGPPGGPGERQVARPPPERRAGAHGDDQRGGRDAHAGQAGGDGDADWQTGEEQRGGQPVDGVLGAGAFGDRQVGHQPGRAATGDADGEALPAGRRVDQAGIGAVAFEVGGQRGERAGLADQPGRHATTRPARRRRR